MLYHAVRGCATVRAGVPQESSSCNSFVERNFVVLTLVVSAIAAVNLFWRLGTEVVSEWDESLYGLSAWEMLHSGNWVETTLLGRTDYYNLKPPLNVWLLALSFKMFGPHLWSLRIVSAVAGCTTVAMLQWWGRKLVPPLAALLAGLVLATSFAFIYVHSGRSGNTDALFTLMILLVVVTLWHAQRQPTCVRWLGALLAAAFLLKGMGALMPLSIVVGVEAWRHRHGLRRQRHAVVIAVTFFAIIAGAWILARWRFDGPRFLAAMFTYDFVGSIVTPLEGHYGGPLYYVNVLQKYHYDWIIAAVIAFLLIPDRRRTFRDAFARCHMLTERDVLLSTWCAATVLIPTLMRTKNSWYLHPFYPVYALGTGWLIARAIAASAKTRRRQVAIVAIVVSAFGVAEGKLAWYSYHRRDVDSSPQGLLLAEAATISGHTLFSSRWNHADLFVVRAIVGARDEVAADAATFLSVSQAGDFWLSTEPVTASNMEHVAGVREFRLYRRTSASGRMDADSARRRHSTPTVPSLTSEHR